MINTLLRHYNPCEKEGVNKMGAVFFNAVARLNLEYAKRQTLILTEVISLEDIWTNELTAVIKKVRAKGGQEVLDFAEELLRIRELPPSILPMYTI